LPAVRKDGFFYLKLTTVNGKFGYINEAGKEITPVKYDKADAFKEGIAEIVLNGKSGYIDKTGKETITAPKYDKLCTQRACLSHN